MNAPTNHHRLQMLTAAAVLTFAMAMAWSAGAIARPADDPTLGVASSSYTSQATDQAAQAAQTDYPAGLRRTYSGASPTAGSGELSTPPVTDNVPSAGGSSNTLPIALAGTVLLLVLGGIGFTMIAGVRMRRSPQHSA